ncbi:MAG: hypothetical protein A2Y36_06635 [Treponema sp. GWA1_62_8]|nr:MAG: hypothetical protein A2Y36_06635 [Treponema sp. GWA1_62_8]
MRPAIWWVAHPTAVHLFADSYVNAEITGYTSYTVYPSPTGRQVMYGMDLGVAADARGRGIGSALFLYRLLVASQLGVDLFIGATRPDNEPMVKMFRRYGFSPGSVIEHYYCEETPVRPGQLYFGDRETIMRALHV